MGFQDQPVGSQSHCLSPLVGEKNGRDPLIRTEKVGVVILCMIHLRKIDEKPKLLRICSMNGHSI